MMKNNNFMVYKLWSLVMKYTDKFIELLNAYILIICLFDW